MGDCRIRILISTDLLDAASIENVDAGSNNKKAIAIAKIYATDSTIREVCEQTSHLWKLFSSSSSNDRPFKLWDCTVYPPKDITSWPTVDYPELTGKKSKTLHDAGYFPSGSWLVLPHDVLPSQFSTADYDDVQYNNKQGDGASQNKSTQSTVLEFVDGSSAAARPLPSQVMGLVTKRFESEDELEKAARDEAIQLRIQNQAQRRKIEVDRAKKLDERIQKLEETASKNEKNKNVSDQVRRMLVKSRATGDKKLKMQDRIYFQCMLDDGGDTLTKEFRFFSPQDTFAKIASSFSSSIKKQSNTNSEVLIKRPDLKDTNTDVTAITTTYRRFPVAMRVYEAMDEKYLTDQVDTMIIRWYPDGESSTPSILDNDDASPLLDKVAGGGDNDIEMEDASSSQQIPIKESEDVAMGAATAAESSSGIIEDKQLADAIRAMDETANKGKKPKKQKKSASALKVRNMQIKAKAKGDVKRVPKIEDRFFLQVALIDSNTGKGTLLDSHFLARTDPLQRLLSSISAIKDPSKWQFVVPQEEEGETKNQFRVISEEEAAMTLKDAEAAGILNCFDRIILRPKLV